MTKIKLLVHQDVPQSMHGNILVLVTHLLRYALSFVKLNRFSFWVVPMYYVLFCCKLSPQRNVSAQNKAHMSSLTKRRGSPVLKGFLYVA